MAKYLTNAELMEKLNRIEEVAEQLRKEVKINNEAHERFYEEFMEKFCEEDKEIAELKKCGFLPPRSVKSIRDKTIIAEFENNKNLLKIADKYGISVHYVRLILKRNKVRHPKVMNFTQKKPNDKIKAIIKELERKKSQSQIAREHNVSRQYINEIKNKWERRVLNDE
jgi:DNA-binding CsgD family transcriptional regulator